MINSLKKHVLYIYLFRRTKNVIQYAVILAHYYQDPDIQVAADFMGDSLALAKQATQTNADIILFCGVHFMCETAKILNSEKQVILPDINAGCSLADSTPPDKFNEWVDFHPDHTVISYINCSIEVKEMSDIICTALNAEKMKPEITLPEDLRIQALIPLENMLALS